MANQRIKDITTTATSVAGDDYLILDGATNGTRKIAATVVASDVKSVFGRNGAVVATAGDYTATLITNTPAGTISAVTVQAAINELDTEKAALTGATFTGAVSATTLTASQASTWTGSLALPSNGLNVGSGQLQVTGGNVVTSGDVTVSGGDITGGTAGLTINSGGTNQNITLTPNGTGVTTTSKPITITATTTATAVNTGALTSANFGFSGNLGGASYLGGSLITSGEVTSAGVNVNTALSTRALAPYYLSDGATANRRVYWPLGQSLASQTVTLRFWLPQMTSDPSVNLFPWYIGSNSPASVTNRDVCSRINTVGNLSIICFGVAGEWREFFLTNFRSTYLAQSGGYLTVVLYGNSTTNPKVLWNTTDISSLFAPSIAGTPPNWMDANLVSTYYVAGLSMPAGAFQAYAPILGELTTAEIQSWVNTGRLPDWCAGKTGTVTPLYASNFSAGTDGWVASGSTIAAVDGVSGVDDVLEITGSSVVEAHAGNKIIGSTGVLKPGYQYLLTGRVFVPDTNTAVKYAKVFFNGESSTASTWLTISGSVQYAASPGWQDIKLVFSVLKTTYSQFGIYVLNASLQTAFDAGGEKIYLKDIQLCTLGPLFIPVLPPTGGTVVYDAGSNGISGVITAGITPIPLQPLSTARIRTTTSTNGNQQLLGAAVLPVGANIMRVRARARTGTPTVYLGNASGGAQIVASVALSTAWKQLAIVAGAEVTTTANLWANSSTTDVVEWDLSYDTM